MLSVIMLSGIMLSVIMLSVIMLNVVAPDNEAYLLVAVKVNNLLELKTLFGADLVESMLQFLFSLPLSRVAK
jgi:hypothetical protein